jgi:hypothetical protein
LAIGISAAEIYGNLTDREIARPPLLVDPVLPVEDLRR